VVANQTFCTLGYIDVVLPGGRESNILHPAYPGSVYHATKCLDALLWQFYQKNDQLRVTDLHQGIVWGTNTPQTIKDERLINRFDYDGDYGTVLNRFLMQGAMGVPLTFMELVDRFVLLFTLLIQQSAL